MDKLGKRGYGALAVARRGVKLRMARANRQILLNEIPQGRLAPEHFRQAEARAPTPDDDEVLVRTRNVALDAANRAWILIGLLAGRHVGKRMVKVA